MADNKMFIILESRDKATAQIKRNLTDMQKQGQKSSKSLTKSFKTIHLQALAVAGAMAGITLAIKDMVKAASKVQQYETRLKGLLGTAEMGNQVFKDMADLASRVPKTYDEIMESATNLAGVVKNGTKDINQLMPIIVDISSATGLTVRDVTGQMIRMYSAGAASADMFKERGISAALGFKAGVSYTAEETMKTIVEQWEDGTGKYVAASEELAKTWEGQMSFMADATFTLRSEIGKLIIQNEVVLGGLENITEVISAFALGIERLSANKETLVMLQTTFNAIAGAGNMISMSNFSGVFDSMFNMGTGAGQEFIAGPQGISPEEEAYNRQLMFNEKKLQEEQEFQNKFANLQRKEGSKRSKEQEKLLADQEKKREKFNSWMLSNMKSTFQMAAQENKAFAVAVQVLNIAEAIMNTAKGVTLALATYPGPAGIAWASLVSAMGMAQVGLIASQGFAEGTDSVPARLTPGEMVFPRTMSDAIRRGDITVSGRNGNTGSNVSVNIEIINPQIRNDQDLDNLVEEISNRISREAERL